MIIIWGWRHYGVVDELTNGWYVSTRFFHLWYIPLIPTGSMLVTAKQGRMMAGHKVGLSGRSYLATYLRFVPIITAIVGICVAIASFSDRPEILPGIVGIVLALASVALTIWAYGARSMRFASPEREAALMRYLEAKMVSGNLPAARGFDVVPVAPTGAVPPLLPSVPMAARVAAPLPPIPLEPAPAPTPAVAQPVVANA